jgi:ribosome recycling factor
MAEDGRVSIRHARRSARHDLEAFEKDGDISADDLARAEKELDKLTHRYEGDVDTALEHKEQELLEVSSRHPVQPGRPPAAAFATT